MTILPTMDTPDSDNLTRTIRRLGICVVMPTYNNAGTLRSVLEGVLRYCPDVIVVNDGSTDSTERILRDFAGRVVAVSHPRNLGKGAALRSGFRRALELGYEYAVTIDSDGQHYPSDLPLMVKAVAEHPGALVVGERDLSGVDINGKSSFANKFSNFWFCVQTGRRLNDTQTGYRAYPLRRLRGLGMLTSRYEAELELLVFAAWNGVEIFATPIRVYYPPRGERVSHFRPALDFSRISLLNTALCFGAVIYGAPSMLWRRIRSRRIFNREVALFTRRDGNRRDASATLGRVARSSLLLSYFAGWSLLVFAPLGFFCTKIKGGRDFLHRFMHRIIRFMTLHFPSCPVDVVNAAGEDFSRPAVIVSNHQSQLDIPLLMSLSPKLIFLTNKWVWENPLFGSVIRAADFLPVHEGMDRILPRLRELREKGYSIVVFPEGTRSENGDILRFHQGAFHLARELGVDIVPVAIHGAGHYLPKNDFMLRKGEISVSVMERIAQEELASVAPLRQASMLRSAIREEYAGFASGKENAEYFRSLVLYRYAYRGWRVVDRCKNVLRHADALFIDDCKGKSVCILNSGMGVLAHWIALANPGATVTAYEENLEEHAIADSTPGIPSNLRFIHPVWADDYAGAFSSDITILLEGPLRREKLPADVCLTKISIRS